MVKQNVDHNGFIIFFRDDCIPYIKWRSKSSILGVCEKHRESVYEFVLVYFDRKLKIDDKGNTDWLRTDVFGMYFSLLYECDGRDIDISEYYEIYSIKNRSTFNCSTWII